MIVSSRPLRFVVLLLAGWIAMRTVQLWPVANPVATILPTLLDTIAPFEAAEGLSESIVRPTQVPPLPSRESSRPTGWTLVVQAGRRSLEARTPKAESVSTVHVPTEHPASMPSVGGPIGSPLPMTVSTAPSPRFRASAWMIIRGGQAVVSSAGPQLGGSQAGMRLTYAIDDARRFALSARISTAIAARQREAAVGVDWQPSALPVHLIAEHRFGIAGSRGGPTVGVIVGIGPTPVAEKWRLEAYGQAGGIARGGRVDGYADGAARIARQAGGPGRSVIDLGLGAWGGAQRGAARLDVGPTASVSLPIGDKAVRIATDWRFRVAGRARPESGPAISIGTDF